MIAETTELPRKTTYTIETVDASRPGIRRTPRPVTVSFAVAMLTVYEDDVDEDLVRSPAMVQRVFDHLDEPVSG
jgi:hypothetical protein